MPTGGRRWAEAFWILQEGLGLDEPLCRTTGTSRSCRWAVARIGSSASQRPHRRLPTAGLRCRWPSSPRARTWEAATLIAAGLPRVGLVGAGGKPLVPGLREIVRLEFRGRCERGIKHVPDRTDDWWQDGAEPRPTRLDAEPLDQRAGGSTWAASDGDVALVPLLFERVFREETELMPWEIALPEFAAEVAPHAAIRTAAAVRLATPHRRQWRRRRRMTHNWRIRLLHTGRASRCRRIRRRGRAGDVDQHWRSGTDG